MDTWMKRAPRALPGLLLGLAVAGCGDEATGPGRAATTGRTSQSMEVARPELVSNDVKYRDDGHKPATGRSGGAEITVRALLGRAGTTDIEVYAGGLGGTGPGELKKVQLKLFDAGGTHLGTLNHNHLDGRAATFTYGGLARGAPLQVQANVDIGKRTGVVTVRDVVKLRPDIAVSSLSAPPFAPTHVPVAITAVLRELNGDVGARTTCVLDVDGVLVDSASGIWVDAGGTVSCEFSRAFAAVGSYTLAVRASGTDPRDYDAANDRAESAIVIRPDVPLGYSASATDDSVLFTRVTSSQFEATPSFNVYTGAWTFYYSDGWRDSVVRTGREQSSRLDVTTRLPLAFPDEPLRDVKLAQATGGATIHEAGFAELPADWRREDANGVGGCVRRSLTGAVIVTFELCTQRSVQGGATQYYTTGSYRWNAGDVTYYSVGSRATWCWDPNYCQTASYAWNDTSRTRTGTLVPFGADFALHMAWVSGGQRFGADPVLTLATPHWVYATPMQCTTSRTVYPPAPLLHSSGRLTTCESMRDEHWLRAGSGSRQ